jgi:chloramphenicol 3-O-phosphotransferase
MGMVLMLSGPIGSGKTAVAQELAALWPEPLIAIEGDRFWPFFVKPRKGDRRENFRLLMRSMTAAAVPFAKEGYDVLLDFSVPPPFLRTARAILKDIPLAYIMLRPSLEVCAARARDRAEGKIANYDTGFYELFAGLDPHVIAEDELDAKSVAAKIRDGVAAGRFRVGE